VCVCFVHLLVWIISYTVVPECAACKGNNDSKFHCTVAISFAGGGRFAYKNGEMLL
jgi:hypothetical protein